MAGPYGTPRTWSSGEKPTAAQFNTEFRDWITALANPPAVRLHHTATQNVVSGGTTLLTWDTEAYDTDSMHEGVTNPTRITFNKAGLYQVSFCVGATRKATVTQFGAYVILNGGTTRVTEAQTGTNTVTTDEHFWVAASATYKFAAADFITLTANQRSSDASAVTVLATAAGQPHFFSATWIGIG